MSGRAARKITGRTIISGRLVLDTPAHFGNGEAVGVADMPLLRDPLDGVRPLLTGASIAGALRSYLRQVERGYGKTGQKNDLVEQLFGRLEGDFSIQSWLLVDDALGELAGIELRDGVAIDPATRTAEDQKKFDIELLAAGTSFDVRFEFLETRASQGLLVALATTLDGLAKGEIGLGQRKRRGFGRCRIAEWCVRHYDLTTPAGLLAWLEEDTAGEKVGPDIFALLGLEQRMPDQRDWFAIEATFGLPGSLLIRSSSAEPGSPDMVHLKSLRQGGAQPIVSGTSLAGAVRSRALRIAQTILDPERGIALVNGMFGHMEDEEGSPTTERSAAGRPMPKGSRVVTEESMLSGSRDLVQSRVKIDRFTGGAFPTALFSQQPVFGDQQASVKLNFALQAPQNAEIGLLLLVLKDLWTGDLPLGGESSVGRGRLQGKYAIISRHSNDATQRWEIHEDGDRLRYEPADTPDALGTFVTDHLWTYRPPSTAQGRSA